jgi:hypothetical protein
MIPSDTTTITMGLFTTHTALLKLIQGKILAEKMAPDPTLAQETLTGESFPHHSEIRHVLETPESARDVGTKTKLAHDLLLRHSHPVPGL